MHKYDYINVPLSLLSPEVVSLITSIHESKGRQELYIEAQSDILFSLLDLAKIQSTKASNQIEGIYTSDERLEALVKEKAEPKNRSEEEIAGYREVLATIHESYEYIAVQTNNLLQLHRDLYSYSGGNIGGAFKNTDNVIAEKDKDGVQKVRFFPVPAFQIPDTIEQLCTEFNKALSETKYDPLILIPMFVLDFLCIHPFNDGNGRMSRLLTLLLLYRAGFIVGKYISLEMLIEQSKETYYEALLNSSVGWHENKNDYSSFVRYMLGIVVKAYNEFEDRVAHLRYRKLSKEDRLRAIFDKRLGKITKSDLMKSCPDISMITIERALSSLLEEGYIEKVGAGRGTAYVKK